MATLSVVWNIKLRQPQSIHETAGQANTALRKHLTQSGSRANDKVDSATSGGFEVITVTRP